MDEGRKEIEEREKISFIPFFLVSYDRCYTIDNQ